MEQFKTTSEIFVVLRKLYCNFMAAKPLSYTLLMQLQTCTQKAAGFFPQIRIFVANSHQRHKERFQVSLNHNVQNTQKLIFSKSKFASSLVWDSIYKMTPNPIWHTSPQKNLSCKSFLHTLVMRLLQQHVFDKASLELCQSNKRLSFFLCLCFPSKPVSFVGSLRHSHAYLATLAESPSYS